MIWYNKFEFSVVGRLSKNRQVMEYINKCIYCRIVRPTIVTNSSSLHLVLAIFHYVKSNQPNFRSLANQFLEIQSSFELKKLPKFKKDRYI